MNKTWYKDFLSVYNIPFSDVPAHIIATVKEELQKRQSKYPMVTVSVIAYNEEKHLMACLWALSKMKCRYEVEIIGVNNDSTDRTAEIFKACGVTYYNENRHSCGFARSCGLSHAKGKYHINIDADTLYPPLYVERMTNALEKKNTVAVCSSWSYIPDEEHSELGLKWYEALRDVFLWIQHFKRPELSVRGLVFAYKTDLAQKIGIRTDIIRGEDGSLALELKRYGKILFLHDREARAVTGYGTMGADGGLLKSFLIRIKKSLYGMARIFTKKDSYKDKNDNLINKTDEKN